MQLVNRYCVGIKRNFTAILSIIVFSMIASCQITSKSKDSPRNSFDELGLKDIADKINCPDGSWTLSYYEDPNADFWHNADINPSNGLINAVESMSSLVKVLQKDCLSEYPSQNIANYVTKKLNVRGYYLVVLSQKMKFTDKLYKMTISTKDTNIMNAKVYLNGKPLSQEIPYGKKQLVYRGEIPNGEHMVSIKAVVRGDKQAKINFDLAKEDPGPDWNLIYSEGMLMTTGELGCHGWYGVPCYADCDYYSGGCGVDICTTAGPGTPVLSPMSGTVIYAGLDGDNPANPYVRVVSDDGQWEYMMMHSNFIVSSGQRVIKGEVIGYEASRGRSSHEHIHLTILNHWQGVLQYPHHNRGLPHSIGACY